MPITPLKTEQNFIDSIFAGLKRALEREADALIKKKQEEVIKEIAEMKTRIVAEYILAIEDFVSIQDFGRNITITVKKETDANS